MLLSMAFLTVLAILSVSLSVTSSERLPGLQMRMSKKGLDYANSIALDALTKQLSGLSIPDQSGKSKNIEYTLSGITERGVTMPSSSMTFDRSRNGLNWAVSGLGIKLHASHWRIKYKKGWFKVSTSGSVDLDIRRASLRVTVSLAQRDGRPRVSLSQCHATIDKVHVDFHGGTAFILNLFRGIIGRKIKDLMQTEICKVAVKLVNNDANEMLAMLKVHVKLGPNFLLDYGLVSPPTVDAYGLELKTKGEIYWKSALKGAPFTPKPIPDLAEDSNMLYLWLTDYLANTAIYQASTNGFLRYNLTSSDYPAAKQSFMETTCELFCVGNLIPLIGMVHPNSKVEAAVNAIGAPTLSMTSQGISLRGELIIDLRVVTPEMKTHDVMSFTMELYLSVTGSVRYERLAGEIIDYRLEVKQIESVIGEVDPEILNSMLKVALDLGVIPNLNALMRQGMDLPVTDIFSFKDTQLILQDGSVLIATDITTLTSSRPTQEEIMQHEMSQKKEKQEQLMVELGHLKQEKREQQENEIQPEEASQTTPKREQETPTPSQTTDHPQTEKLTVTDKPKAQTEQTDMTNNPSASEELRTTEQPQGNDEESNAPQEKEQPKTKPDNNNAFCSHVIEFCHSSIKYCT